MQSIPEKERIITNNKKLEKRFFEELKQKILYNFFPKFQIYEFQIAKEAIEHYLRTPHVVKKEEPKETDSEFFYRNPKPPRRIGSYTDNSSGTMYINFCDIGGDFVTMSSFDFSHMSKRKADSADAESQMLIDHRWFRHTYLEATSGYIVMFILQFIHYESILSMNTFKKIPRIEKDECFEYNLKPPILCEQLEELHEEK